MTGIVSASAMSWICASAPTCRLSFCGRGLGNEEIDVHVGKKYTGMSTGEATEVDASVEAPGVLVFFEAKLYSAVSPAVPPQKPHDQIARKLRVGLDSTANGEREFLFVFLDLAPLEMMIQRKPKQQALEQPGGGYKDKWRSAWLFNYYKKGRNKSRRPLANALSGIAHPPVQEVAARMGWLTWADLFKCTLRATLAAKAEGVTK